jgi:hypothetical protein
LLEYKKVLQPIETAFTPNEDTLTATLTNRLAFTDLDTFDCVYRMRYFDRTVSEARIALPSIPPGESLTISMPGRPAELFGLYLDISYTTRYDSAWAAAGHEVAWAQFVPTQTAQAAPHARRWKPELSINETNERTVAHSPIMTALFDRKDEAMYTMEINGIRLFDSKFEPMLWRAPTDNDHPTAEKLWRDAGLDRLQKRVEYKQLHIDNNELFSTSSYALAPTSQMPVARTVVNLVLRGNGEGRVVVDYTKQVLGKDREFPYLPRLGVRVILPRTLTHVTWYGKGPHESYLDKQESARVGLYKSDVEDLTEPYIRPQENGAHEQTDFVALTSDEGWGVAFAALTPFAFTAHPYTTESLTDWDHAHDVKDEGLIELILDKKTAPLGSNSCGPEPLQETLLNMDKHESFMFKFAPIDTSRQSAASAAERMIAEWSPPEE